MNKMTKRQLAEDIESHHLYTPRADGVYSKNYYRYSSSKEISLLLRLTKAELQDMHDMLYSDDGREFTAHEIGW